MPASKQSLCAAASHAACATARWEDASSHGSPHLPSIQNDVAAGRAACGQRYLPPCRDAQLSLRGGGTRRHTRVSDAAAQPQHAAGSSRRDPRQAGARRSPADEACPAAARRVPGLLAPCLELTATSALAATASLLEPMWRETLGMGALASTTPALTRQLACQVWSAGRGAGRAWLLVLTGNAGLPCCPRGPVRQPRLACEARAQRSSRAADPPTHLQVDKPEARQQQAAVGAQAAAVAGPLLAVLRVAVDARRGLRARHALDPRRLVPARELAESHVASVERLGQLLRPVVARGL